MVLTVKTVNLFQFGKSIITISGEFSIFVGQTLRSCRFLWKRKDLFFKQCEFIGVSSIGIVLAAALFMGAVLGYQLYVSLHRFGSEALLGGTVGMSLYRELAPVMSAIMVTGRAGAAMAAEISSMRVSEQIDALEVMAIDPIEYLVSPRVAAGVCMMPFLAVFFSWVASIAAGLVACEIMDLGFPVFWDNYFRVVDPIELVHCTFKAGAFGLILTWIGCFCGFRAYGGARAVGQATRNTVVSSCLGILLSDYFMTSLLPFGFKTLKIM